MFIFNPQKNISSFRLILFFVFLVFISSLIFLNKTKAVEEEIVAGPIERKLCERIPLEETLRKYQQFQEEFVKTLSKQKQKAEQVFANGLDLADNIILHNSRFCDSKTLCEETACREVRVCATKKIFPICWGRWVEICCPFDVFDCIRFCIGILEHWVPTIIHEIKYTHVIFRRGNWVKAPGARRLTCPGARDHNNNLIYATERLVPFAFLNRSTRFRDSTTCRYLCLQDCGERIRENDITGHLWGGIEDKIIHDRTRKHCSGTIIFRVACVAWELILKLLHDELFLDKLFESKQGIRVGYHCTAHTAMPCSGSPFIGGIRRITALQNEIEKYAKENRQALIENTLFKRALAELMGSFDNIRQNFRIWYETRVGVLADCFEAKQKGLIDICKHDLDYYICK